MKTDQCCPLLEQTHHKQIYSRAFIVKELVKLVFPYRLTAGVHGHVLRYLIFRQFHKHINESKAKGGKPKAEKVMPVRSLVCRQHVKA